MNIRSLFACAAAAGVASVPARAQRVDTLRVSIPDAVSYVLRSSDENKLALLNVASADAAVTTALAPGLPQARFIGNYNQVLRNARGDIVGSVFGQSYTYQGTVGFSQVLFQGGKILSGSRAALNARSASRYDAGETRARLAVDVQRSYLNALYLARISELQDQNLALSTERLQQVEQLAAAGRASRYDVLRARVDRANIEPLAIQARSDRDIALLDVKRFLDIPVERPLVLTTTLDTAAVQAIVGVAVADTLADPVRGSVRSAELSLLAKRDAIRVARGDFFPQVNAVFNFGYLALPSQNGLPDRFGQASAIFCPPGSTAGKICQNNGFFADRSFGLQISWAVLDGMRAKGNVDLATAQARIAEVTLHQQREAAAIETARARAEFDRARLAYAARTENSIEADEAFRLASLRFTRGLATQLEVSDAQIALLTARSTEARAVYDLYLAAAELARVRGRPIPLPTGRTLPVRSNSGLSSASDSH